ncbi:hypothetical protein [Staphylococcus felis]|uniref:hypothetical protein n=1 Tax=Staphylococcus felis TaxID=46127 RepID=UPI001F4DA566|nr:hypothetical protein [Staphylococcus felis]
MNILTAIFILAIIVAVGLTIYYKHQEVEIEKAKIQAQLDRLQKQEKNIVQEDSTERSIHPPSLESTNDVESSQDMTNSNRRASAVNRDNVMDYLTTGINQSEGGDASLIQFREPEQQADGSWRIGANNKSGVGSHTFFVRQDGTVEFWNGIMTDKEGEVYVELQ